MKENHNKILSWVWFFLGWLVLMFTWNANISVLFFLIGVLNSLTGDIVNAINGKKDE